MPSWSFLPVGVRRLSIFLSLRAAKTSSLIFSFEFKRSANKICRFAKGVVGSNSSSTLSCHVFSAYPLLLLLPNALLEEEEEEEEESLKRPSSSRDSANAEKASSVFLLLLVVLKRCVVEGW